jgi:hypothetical protein
MCYQYSPATSTNAARPGDSRTTLSIENLPREPTERVSVCVCARDGRYSFSIENLPERGEREREKERVRARE